jgi:hypothetical protein
MSWSRLTTDGRYACEATSKQTESEPFTTATTYRWGRVKTPTSYAAGSEASAGRTTNVGSDHDRSPADAVDPDANGNPQYEIRHARSRGEQRDLESARLEDEDRRQRESENRHLAADRADPLRAP